MVLLQRVILRGQSFHVLRVNLKRARLIAQLARGVVAELDLLPIIKRDADEKQGPRNQPRVEVGLPTLLDRASA